MHQCIGSKQTSLLCIEVKLADGGSAINENTLYSFSYQCFLNSSYSERGVDMCEHMYLYHCGAAFIYSH